MNPPHQVEVTGLSRRPFRYRSSQKLPSVLHVSRESRSMGLSKYTLTFSTTSTPEHGTAISSPARIYVNWNQDLILLRPDGLRSGERHEPHEGCKPLNHDAVDDFAKYKCIRRLAISMNEVSDLEQYLSRMQIEELVLYNADYYVWCERFKKYTPFHIGVLDPGNTKTELADAFRRDGSWRRSLWLTVQFRGDHITDPEKQIGICAGMVDFVRRRWISGREEGYAASEPLKLKIARHV